MEAYRICEKKNNELLTLFHGINGSRKLEMNTWLEAKVKPVRDGSRRTSKEYMSGFHSIGTLEECIEFVGKFRKARTLVIVKLEIEGNIWKKEHSPANIILSEKIKLLEVVKEINICK